MNKIVRESDGKEFTALETDEEIANYINWLKEHNADEMTAKKTAGVQILDDYEVGDKFDVFTKSGLEAMETLQEGFTVVRGLDKNGNVILDNHGNPNQWQIDNEKLEKRYDIENAVDGKCLPRGSEQDFIRIDSDIAVMKPWGENGVMIPQYIDEGGFLNITDMSDVYGIAAQEFDETYTYKVKEAPEIEGREV